MSFRSAPTLKTWRRQHKGNGIAEKRAPERIRTTNLGASRRLRERGERRGWKKLERTDGLESGSALSADKARRRGSVGDIPTAILARHSFRSASLKAIVRSSLPLESRTRISPERKHARVSAYSIASCFSGNTGSTPRPSKTFHPQG